MKPHPVYLFILALGLMLPACALVDGTENGPDVYEGVFSQGFEDSPFEPCGRSEQWLITTGDTTAMRIFREQVFDVLRAGSNPMYARLHGTLSPKGEYPGIFITYDRQLELTEVLDIRPLRGLDCR